MQKYTVDHHEESLLPEGNWKLVWNDEFDGSKLDRTKWDFRLAMMGKRFPGWTDKAVRLDGKSNVVFSIIEEDGRPVCSQIQTGYNFMDEPVIRTKFGKDDLQWGIGKLKKSLYTHKYGYYECRCRLQQHPEAWWSAFWMQSPIIGASLDTADTGAEIDIMECFEKNTILKHCIWAGGYGQDIVGASCGGKSDIDQTVFHRFGLLWDEHGYTFFIDGEENGHTEESVSGHPEFILLSTEIKGYRKGEHKPVKEAFQHLGQDAFIVDYVRVFDKIN